MSYPVPVYNPQQLVPRSRNLQGFVPATPISVAEAQRAVVAVEVQQVLLGTRIVTPPPTGSTTYNDSGSGTITLTGSGVEAFSTPPPRVVAQAGQTNQGAAVATSPVTTTLPVRPPAIVAGAASATVYNDSGTGTITLTGSGVEAFSASRLTVSIQGRPNQGGVLAAPTAATPGEPKDPQPQTFVYYNAAPPIYNVIVQGGTNQGFKMGRVIQPGGPDVGNARIVAVRSPSTFNDSGTVIITLSGTGTENFISGGTTRQRMLTGVGL